MKRQFEAGRWIAELRPAGPLHFVVAGFLVFWLAGWAAGENFAITAAARLLASGGADGRSATSSGAATLPVLTFFTVWLTAWTAGGLFALFQALRQLLGYDRIEYDGAGLKRLSGLGPFLGGRAFPRAELRGLSLDRRGLVARTGSGSVVLTRFGTAADQAELLQEMRRELHLDESASDPIGTTPDQPPAGWETAPELGGIVLRRQHGRLNPLRQEYRLGPGRIEESRGLGRHLRVASCENPDLAIEHSKDNDGDDVYRLVIRHVAGRSEVAQATDDPFPLVQLGRWMARRIERPLAVPRELDDRFAA